MLERAGQNVKRVDNALDNCIFYLGSGHGGPGAVGKVSGHTVTEDEYAYDVTLRIGRQLMSHGAQVHFIIRDLSVGIRDDRYLKNNKTEVCYPATERPSPNGSAKASSTIAKRADNQRL